MGQGDDTVDILVIGGGINGVGIARDAVGRGLSVLLCERGDLAGATSSRSSKLVHGGLRYLEQYEFRLVHESLAEREVLLAAAGHIIRPLRFIIPIHAGLRPPWLIRLGLFLYDHIGGRKVLPPTRTVRRGRSHGLEPLKSEYRLGFEYSDCWADDARLVVITAMDAAERGAQIEVGWALQSARRDAGAWVASLVSSDGDKREVRARALVNAAGPWVGESLKLAGINTVKTARLVKGSHIVVPALYEGDHAYTFQNEDGRVVFTIPYQDVFTLIGTTDVPYDDDPAKVAASADEIAYLCEVASQYMQKSVTPADVVWTYSGVRPLYDDGDVSASNVTRDYVFDLDLQAGAAPLLSIFGGKLTTHRELAEHAMRELLPLLQVEAEPWTAKARLPGGDFEGRIEDFVAACQARWAFAPPAMIGRMAHAYGSRIDRVLGEAGALADLGEAFAPDLYEAELRYMRDHEWARTGEDALWRRSKLGLALEDAQKARVQAWFAGA